jgi:hypothetical protein
MNRLYVCLALAGCFGVVRAQNSGTQRRDLRPVGSPAGNAAVVSGKSPFSAGCNGKQTGSVYLNSAVEPFLAVDPGNLSHLVGVWQQDRWNNGGANGVLAAVTMDGGRTWRTSKPAFSVCAGGSYERASDPWVSIAPDGTVHFAALVLNNAGAVTAVMASRSTDGGLTWSAPMAIDQPSGGSDKESITADPTNAQYVYAIWDSTNSDRVPAWFTRSTDGGLSWEPARVIYDPERTGGYATAHQILVLPDGKLMDVFALGYDTGNGQQPTNWIAVMRSADQGASWSPPTIVSNSESIGIVNAKTQQLLRSGSGIPSAAVDPVSGTTYVVWPDARFNGGVRDGIALSKSDDGGLTWSAPVQVNQATNVQAFMPSVAVSADGKVAVTYYDFRQDTNSASTLLTNTWRIVSADGGATWKETPVAGPFDMLSAPYAAGSPFLGDYQGMAASGDLFVSFFVTANPTSVTASSVVAPPDLRNNMRTEVNQHPRRPKPDGLPGVKK